MDRDVRRRLQQRHGHAHTALQAGNTRAAAQDPPRSSLRNEGRNGGFESSHQQQRDGDNRGDSQVQGGDGPTERPHVAASGECNDVESPAAIVQGTLRSKRQPDFGRSLPQVAFRRALHSRFSANHNIEVLVQMENASIFGALWVPQSKLHSRGEKELDAYFGRQLLFSSLWRAILNVAEVGASPVFHA